MPSMCYAAGAQNNDGLIMTDGPHTLISKKALRSPGISTSWSAEVVVGV